MTFFRPIITFQSVRLKALNLALYTFAQYFKPGPWSLGIWAYPIGAVGTLWTGFMIITFSLPTSYPVEGETLNFAGIMLLGVTLLNLTVYFFPVYGAHAWFKGPDTYNKDLPAIAAFRRSTIGHLSVVDEEASNRPAQVLHDGRSDHPEGEIHARRSHYASRALSGVSEGLGQQV